MRLEDQEKTRRLFGTKQGSPPFVMGNILHLASLSQISSAKDLDAAYPQINHRKEAFRAAPNFSNFLDEKLFLTNIDATILRFG